MLCHLLRICVVGLALTHPLFRLGKQVQSVDFDVGRRNKLDAAPRGKRKRGAIYLHADSLLCKITCTDGTEFLVRCGMGGTFIEANERLKSNPQLLIDKVMYRDVSDD